MSTDSVTEVERLRAELTSTHANLAFLGLLFAEAESATSQTELAELLLERLAEYLGIDPAGGFYWLGDQYRGASGVITGSADIALIEQLSGAMKSRYEGAVVATGADGTPYIVISVRAPSSDMILGMIAMPVPAGFDPDSAQMATAGALGPASLVHLRRLVRESRLKRDALRSEAAMRGKLDLAEPSSLIDGLAIVNEEFGQPSGFTSFAVVLLDDDLVPTACAGEPIGLSERQSIELAGGFAGLERAILADEFTIAAPVCQGDRVRALIVARDDEGVNDVDLNVLMGLAAAIGDSASRRDSRNELSRMRSNTARQLIAAQERERAKIAADIHDDVIQQLSATAMRLELVLARIKRGPTDIDEVAEVIQEETSRLRDAVADTRSLLMDIRPQELDDNGLMPALQELARRVPEVDVDVEYDIAGEVNQDIATSIFRITQEALSNVRKHSQAEHAHVELGERNGSIILQVQDDGIGYEASATGPSELGSHFGLLGMRERVRMHGGHFSIKGAAGEGTTLRVDLPKAGLRDG